MSDADELFAHLPRVLKVRPLMALLMPTPRTPPADRGVYPMRMTVLGVGHILFWVQLAIFLWLGDPKLALHAGVGVVASAVGGGLVRKNFPHLGLFVGLGAVFGFLASVHLRYGLAANGWLFVFPISIGAFFVYRRDEWLLRLVPLSLCVAVCALVVFPLTPAPEVVLSAGGARFLLVVHVMGSLYGTFVLGSHSAAFREAASRRIASERDRADGLLLNILPPSIAARLMKSPLAIVDDFPNVSVLFADVVGFTKLSGTVASAQLVEMLGALFTEFDALAKRHGLEKIKTIGDAYMVAGGLPEPSDDHAGRAVAMAIQMHAVVAAYAQRSGHPLALRIGVNGGPVTAGVIGKMKFAYDLWGDTVNVASRMESHGEPGKVQVTRAIFEQLKDRYPFVPRGTIEVKGKGPMETWLLTPG